MIAAIRLRNLTLTYQRHPVVHHLSGEFSAGTCTAIVGPNGAGKSTLMKALVGMLPAEQGHIEFVGQHRRDLAYLPQQAAIDRSFPLGVRDAVLAGDWKRSGWFGRISRTTRARADEALAQVGLDGFALRPIDELSAGQFQRVLFARILLQNAPLILLDEPFTALDAKTTADLLAIIATWRQQGRSVIAVLHDFEQVRSHFPQTLLLAKESVAWGDTASVMTAANLQRASAMAQAWNDNAPLCQRTPAELTP